MTLRDVTETHIAACCSGDQLLDWHEAFHEEADRLACELEAKRLAGTIQPFQRRGYEHRLMICGMSMRRIEGRAVELGYPAIVSRRGHERDAIRRLTARVAELEAMLRRGRAA